MPGILQIKPSKQQVRVFCPFCIHRKNRSKKFSSIYALKYHVTSEHADEIYPNDLTLENVQNLLRAIEKAIQMGMVRQA